MRKLSKLKENKLLFYDIETASVVKALELDTPLFDSWAYKVDKTGEMTNDEIIESFAQRSGLYPEFAKIVSIVVGKIVKGKIHLITLDGDDEKAILEGFNGVLERNLSCSLVGFVSSAFDAPFIYKRSIINGVQPHDNIDYSGLKPWDLTDIDLAMEWKGTSFERASLINVATAFGLPSPKSDISGADVGKVYWNEGAEGMARISKYCGRDVVTTINVFKKMRLEDALEEAAPTAKVEEVVLDTLTKLFEGGRYGAAEKKELSAALSEFSKEDLDKACTLLDAATSTAKGKKTKLTKAHVKALKKEVLDERK